MSNEAQSAAVGGVLPEYGERDEEQKEEDPGDIQIQIQRGVGSSLDMLAEVLLGNNGSRTGLTPTLLAGPAQSQAGVGSGPSQAAAAGAAGGGA